jgi:hypothetical protein
MKRLSSTAVKHGGIMDRRNVAGLLLGTATGSLLLNRTAGAQVCTPPCYPQSPDESITPVDFAQEPGSVRRFGADGSGTDTAALNNAFNSGVSAVNVLPGTYVSGQITASQTLKRISGSGVLKQAAEGSDLLLLDGNTNLVVEGIHFLGASGTGLPSAASNNTGLTIRNARGVVISGCHFERFRFFGLYLENCDDVVIEGNYFYQTALPLRLRGCRKVVISNNVVRDTCLASSVFTVGIGLDSTDGHSFGICRDILINGNCISGMNNAQGILAHAGEGVVITNNAIRETAIPISCNPFNSTDSLMRVCISANTLNMPASGTFTNANDGIVVQGGPGTPDPTEITIAANTINSANRVMQSAGMGAIRVGYSQRVAVTGNVITTAYGNGIVLTDSEESVAISGNLINDIAATASGAQRGIWVASSGSNVIIDANHISDIAGASGTGIDVDGSGQVMIRDNLFRNVTTRISGGSNATYGNTLTVTSGTSIDLGGVDLVDFNHASATTVSTFTNVIPYKLYAFHFENGNTTINRTHAFLDGGTNKTGSAHDVMLVLGWLNNTIKQAGPMTANS